MRRDTPRISWGNGNKRKVQKNISRGVESVLKAWEIMEFPVSVMVGRAYKIE